MVDDAFGTAHTKEPLFGMPLTTVVQGPLLPKVLYSSLMLNAPVPPLAFQVTYCFDPTSQVSPPRGEVSVIEGDVEFTACAIVMDG